MPPKPRNRKQRTVVDTNVRVAVISGFRVQYIAGRIPSAYLLHRWADGEHFVWLYSEDILAERMEALKVCRFYLLRSPPSSIRLRSCVDSGLDELYS